MALLMMVIAEKFQQYLTHFVVISLCELSVYINGKGLVNNRVLLAFCASNNPVLLTRIPGRYFISYFPLFYIHAPPYHEQLYC